jgi:hypothetical protein
MDYKLCGIKKSWLIVMSPNLSVRGGIGTLQKTCIYIYISVLVFETGTSQVRGINANHSTVLLLLFLRNVV